MAVMSSITANPARRSLLDHTDGSPCRVGSHRSTQAGGCLKATISHPGKVEVSQAQLRYLFSRLGCYKMLRGKSAWHLTHIHSAHVLQEEAHQQHADLDWQPNLQQPHAVSTIIALDVCTCAAYNAGNNPQAPCSGAAV